MELALTTRRTIEFDRETYQYEWTEVTKKGQCVKVLSVFQNNKLIGSKEYTYPVDENRGVILYSIKSILRSISLS